MLQNYSDFRNENRIQQFLNSDNQGDRDIIMDNQ